MSSVSNGCIIDKYCNNQDGEIVGSKDNIYNCTLNQTNIDDNKNKFYIMQLIKSGSSWIHFIRYGRIGEPGRASHKSFTSEALGKRAFEKQFKSKTGNTWNTDFTEKKGKYFMTEISYDDVKSISDSSPTKDDVDSKLHGRVQWFIQLISDITMMKNTLVELDIDTKKMPLGKISKKQIKSAQAVIKKIRTIVNKIDAAKRMTDKKKAELQESMKELSSKYYTLIPYACGRRKPPMIDTQDILQKFTNILDDLENLVVATKIVEKTKKGANPLDNVYSQLNATINPVEKKSRMWKEIEKYVTNTHAPTHSFKMKLVEAFEVSRKGEFEAYNAKYGKFKNKQLLIHGSRMSNWCSIIQNGLLLDPSRLGVFISGKMFGYGVYFANSFSKSANYCGVYGKGYACLTLAEVALGNESQRKKSDYYASKASLEKEGCDSTWGVGNMAPSSSTIIDDLIIPNGKLANTGKGSVLRYDEKIVYDSDQFVLRYLVVIELS